MLMCLEIYKGIAESSLINVSCSAIIRVRVLEVDLWTPRDLLKKVALILSILMSCVVARPSTSHLTIGLDRCSAPPPFPVPVLIMDDSFLDIRTLDSTIRREDAAAAHGEGTRAPNHQAVTIRRLPPARCRYI
ncbi:unnamed protein product [Cyprideis torosa]|uniref:Uncharacterized protein n=1 Tax=Cyprideis torosa TaxID=163714 RepID=A0A7R8ZMK9_9CRUS|nr:unnamed protein product [Cyprideis torosa]CAG0884581.1 unnamed protein product [Cyprideis torosa]